MGSPFNRLDQLASASVEAVFGERVRFVPVKGGKYTEGARDPDREEKDFTAVVTVDQGVQRTDGDSIGDKFGIGIVGAPIRISVNASLFPVPDKSLRKGDRLIALERPGQPVFEVVRPAPDNATRIVIFCVEATK